MTDNTEAVQELATPDFTKMTLPKLREYAALQRLPVDKTTTREELIEAIHRKLAGRVMPQLADKETDLRPGYARIRIEEDPSPTAKQIPVYINDNGYECTIPRGVEVIVPQRVVRNLQNATAKRLRQVEQDNGPPITKEVRVPSYPFQVIESKPGPEVLTKREMQARKKFAPRLRYWQQFGKWPKPRELAYAIQQGFLNLESGEELDRSTQELVSTPNLTI
jgi:hypothetical protein